MEDTTAEILILLPKTYLVYTLKDYKDTINITQGWVQASKKGGKNLFLISTQLFSIADMRMPRRRFIIPR